MNPGLDTGAIVRVLELWRHPVKSLQGERLRVATIERDGLAGDRGWGVLDAITGKVLTGRRNPPLLMACASLNGDGTPHIVLPDGTMTDGTGKTTDAILSAWLGRPVRLVSANDSPAAVGEYFYDATDDTSDVLEWTMPSGRFVDTLPLQLLTTASLRAGAAALPSGDWAVRRFRPNLLIEAEGTGWPEDRWYGHALRVGTVRLTAERPCVRCSMVTRPQPGIDRDLDVYRTLLALHKGTFGMMASVTAPGTVRVGDTLEVSASP